MPLKINANTVITDDHQAAFDRITYRAYALKISQAQGFYYGYISGGYINPAAITWNSNIERYPFTSDITNTTDVGDLAVGGGQHATATQSSTVSAYNTYLGSIFKFPFASTTATSSTVGTVTVNRYQSAGQSSLSYGYQSGGAVPGVPAIYNTIDRFPFASDTNATSVGTLSVTRYVCFGQSSQSYGYTSGGLAGTITPTITYSNVIDRFPFATSTTNATNVGTLTLARQNASGQNSGEYGYSSGGITTPGAFTDTVDRFPFAADTGNASDVGNLTVIRCWTSGQSSVDYGYASGGLTPAAPLNLMSDVIDRWPFASATVNATDVGNMIALKAYSLGNQV